MPTTHSTRPAYEPSPDLSPALASPPLARLAPPARCQPTGRPPAGPPHAATPTTDPSAASSPAHSMSSAPNLQWSAEQINTCLAIAQQKAELEFQATTAKTRHDEEKTLAKTAVICILANSPASADPMRIARENEEVLIDEISPIILSVTGYYLDLPKAKIARIYQNRFKSENFYKSRHLQGNEDKDRDGLITFEYGQESYRHFT